MRNSKVYSKKLVEAVRTYMQSLRSYEEQNGTKAGQVTGTSVYEYPKTLIADVVLDALGMPKGPRRYSRP